MTNVSFLETNMSVVELDQTNFTSTINNNELVVVDFWAPWCGPCKSFAPIYEQAAIKTPDVIFAKVNTEIEQQIATNFQIRSIPTLMIFREQIIIFNQPGMMTEQHLIEIIAKAKLVNMDEVRKSVNDQQA